jgi:hypothetical protein
MPEHGDLIASFSIMIARPIDLGGHKVVEFSDLIGAKFGDLVQSSVTVVFRYIQAIDRKTQKNNITKVAMTIHGNFKIRGVDLTRHALCIVI